MKLELLAGDCWLATAGLSLLAYGLYRARRRLAESTGRALKGPREGSGRAPGWRREDLEIALGAMGGPGKVLERAEEAMNDLSGRSGLTISNVSYALALCPCNEDPMGRSYYRVWALGREPLRRATSTFIADTWYLLPVTCHLSLDT